MKRFKILYLLIILPIFTNIICGKANFGGPADLSGLNLNDAESQELQQFINALNNLPPEEQEFLAQLGQEMEKQMKDKGLDPSNPDDIFKWVDQQQPTDKPQKQAKEPITPPKVPQGVIPETKPIAVKDTKYTKLMLNEIIKYLGSLRQKAITRESLNISLKRWAQELNDLTNYLHILTKQDLLSHLASKDFTKLHQNLERLRDSLEKYEPTIAPKEPMSDDEEDPYEILSIPYGATQRQIREAYQEIKELKNPDIIKRELEELGINKKEREIVLKEARISFSFIQNAYETLKDPKQKAIIDRHLKDRIEAEKRNEASSLNAFKKILNIISSTLYEQKVLQDIIKLLEKYKPEELAQLKAQEEIEKKVFERTKQMSSQKAQTITTGPMSFEDQQYGSFYQQLAQDKAMRDYSGWHKPSFESGIKAPSRPPIEEPALKAPEKKGGPEAGGPKKDEAGDKGKDKDKDKDKEKDKKSPESGGGVPGMSGGPKPQETDKKAEEFLDLIKDTAKILKSAKEKSGIDELAPVAPTRKKLLDIEDGSTEDELPAPEKVTVPYSTITKELENYLVAPMTRSATPNPAVNRIKSFIEQNKLKELAANLGKIKKDAKSADEKAKSIWSDKMPEHSSMINNWFNNLFINLDTASRHNNNLAPIHGDKVTLHNLGENIASIDDEKKKKAEKNLFDLSLVKKLIFDIHTNFNELNKIMKPSAKAEKAKKEASEKETKAAAAASSE